jgi:hypothetical protein
VVLYQGSKDRLLWSIWGCSFWCQSEAAEASVVGFSSHGGWDGWDQAFAGSHPKSEGCQWRCAIRYVAHGVLSATANSASSASCFQTLVILWLGRFFSSVGRGYR